MIAVTAWVIAVTGMAVWFGILLAVASAVVFPARLISFGCARCDWAVSAASARRSPRWLLQARYRPHCVLVHRDWPPIYVRRPDETPNEEAAS